MMHRNFAASIAVLTGTVALAFSSAASAQLLIQDDFTLANDLNNWKTFNGACLTAGDGTGTIPKCVGLPYYGAQALVGGNSGTLPDPVGSGALRFTNGSPGGYNQAGGIISNFTFPTGAGLQVTFKTVTYRGDSGGGGHDGADGISFFLMDGASIPYDTGAFGGSLGYSCSNNNNDGTLRADGTARGYDGLAGAYLGLGIDEYGNFLNQGDNSATGFGYVPGRIGLRGPGSVSFAWLHLNYALWYPLTLTTAQRANAVKNTCKTGVAWDYSNPAVPVATTTTVPDYLAIPGANVTLSGVTIATEGAQKRPDAIPITYSLKITQDRLLSLSYSYNGGAYQPVISKQDVSLLGPMPSSFRFGFNGSTGGSTNIHEIMCFQATPADLAGTSVGVNEKQATKIATGTQAFLAIYYPATSTGRLTASDLLYDGVSISIASQANWDAACNLTGVASGQFCPTTGAAGLIAPQGPTARTILTWDGSNGRPFQYSTLPGGMRSVIDAGDAPKTANRVNYLRGDRTNEINSVGVGLYRARDGILGDIVDSSPTWVGQPNSPYTAVWTDLIHSSATAPENSAVQSYTQYLSTAQTRENVVYTGANDGLLHGFRSGAFDANGNYVTTTVPNDGKEVLAYMPGAVFKVIHNPTDGTVDYSNSQYAHAFYVDQTPDADDLFYNSSWHTWLVGGLGAGGNAIYALDVTDPTTFSEANASSVVVGEWTPATITCVNVSSCGTHLGNTYGVPVVRRLHNGMWAAIFGNGFGSAAGDAGIFVMVVNPSNGSQTFYYYGAGSAGVNNGIASVAPADLDGDHITDYVYAGDLLGNVWRFDMTSTSPGAWGAAASPLFTTPSGQPITTKLLLAIVPQPSGPPRMLVDFGTGRKIPQSTTSSATYSSGSQSLYGIWDWNMNAWNTLATSTNKFATLTGPQSVTLATLQTQTFTTPTPGVRDVTANNVCWAGSTTCGSGNTQFGWVLPLPAAGEQIVFSPLLFQNAFIVNTTIPANNSLTTCAAITDTGYTIAINLSTGGLLPGFFKNYSDTSSAGSLTNGTGTPFMVNAAGQQFLLTQSLGNGCATCTIPCPPGALYCSRLTKSVGQTGKRLTWIERR